MKTITLFITFFIVSLGASSLEDKIKQLQYIEPQKRYLLMNEIKQELIQLNSAQREMALKKLKQAMFKNKYKHQRNRYQKHNKMKHYNLTHEIKKAQHKFHKKKGKQYHQHLQEVHTKGKEQIHVQPENHSKQEHITHPSEHPQQTNSHQNDIKHKRFFKFFQR
jgi:hypothetical protein